MAMAAKVQNVSLKGSPPPPFIVTRRGGVHAQGNVKVVVFPRIAGVQWSNTVRSVGDMPKSPSSQYGLKAQKDIDPRGIRVTNGPMR